MVCSAVVCILAGTSSAGTATLIANGGTNAGLGGVITFDGDSDGGTSRVEVFGNGTFDISAHNSPGVYNWFS